MKEGTSAGGILIGRAITERPGLFAAAVSNVSCSNAPRMETSPNGSVNSPFTEDKKVTFRNFANIYAFALWQAGHPNFQPIAAAAVK